MLGTALHAISRLASKINHKLMLGRNNPIFIPVRSPAFQANIFNAIIASLAGSVIASTVLIASNSYACALLGMCVYAANNLCIALLH